MKLDNELDKYFNKDPEMAEAKLDNDLDEYKKKAVEEEEKEEK